MGIAVQLAAHFRGYTGTISWVPPWKRRPMQLLPLTLHEDPDIPEAVSPFVKVCIDGAPGLALLDTGAPTSSVRDRPGLLTRSVMPRGLGSSGSSGTGSSEPT